MSSSFYHSFCSTVAFLLANTGLFTTALADQDITRSISVESNNFTGSSSTAELATSIDDLNEFTADFSMLGDEDLTITWEAPLGKLIEVTRPAGFSGPFVIEFILGTGGTSAEDAFEDVDPDVTYSGLDGDTPNSGTRHILLSGSSLEGLEATITESLEPGESVKFRSLTASTTVDSSYDEEFDNLALTEFLLRGTASTAGMDAPADPGQWIQLVDEFAIPVAEEIDPITAEKKKLKRSIKKLKKRIKRAKRAGQSRKARSLSKRLKAKKAILRAL